MKLFKAVLGIFLLILLVSSFIQSVGIQLPTIIKVLN